MRCGHKRGRRCERVHEGPSGTQCAARDSRLGRCDMRRNFGADRPEGRGLSPDRSPSPRGVHRLEPGVVDTRGAAPRASKAEPPAETGAAGSAENDRGSTGALKIEAVVLPVRQGACRPRTGRRESDCRSYPGDLGPRGQADRGPRGQLPLGDVRRGRDDRPRATTLTSWGPRCAASTRRPRRTAGTSDGRTTGSAVGAHRTRPRSRPRAPAPARVAVSSREFDAVR